MSIPTDLIESIREIERKGLLLLRTGDYSEAEKIFSKECELFTERQAKDESKRIHKGSPLHNLGLSSLFGGNPFKGLRYVLLAYIEDILSGSDKGSADNLPACIALRSIFAVPPTNLRELEDLVLEKKKGRVSFLYPEKNLVVFESVIKIVEKQFGPVSDLYKHEIQGQKYLSIGDFESAKKVYVEWYEILLRHQKDIQIRIHKGHPIHNLGVCFYSQQRFDDAVKHFFLAYVEDVISEYSPNSADNLPAFKTLKDGFGIDLALLRRIESVVFEKKSKEEVLDPSQVMTELEARVVEEREKLSKSLSETVKSKEEKEKKLLSGFITTKAIEDIFVVLRRWNSSTPRFPALIESGKNGVKSNVGGGYYMGWRGKGVAIDPGYDFLPLFFREGYGVNHIDAILATHAHDDHTQDIETIFSLIFKMNKKLNYQKRIDLLGSEGVKIKYSRLIEVTQTIAADLIPEETVDLGQKGYNFSIQATRTDHNETPWMKNNTGVGLVLQLQLPDGNGTFKIGITGDTRYWDGLEKAFEGVGLLVVHLGTIGDPQSMHLQEEGCRRTIQAINPKLAIVSEFGEELVDQRCNICERIKAWISQIGRPGPGISILPGDVGLKIKVPSLKIYCENINDYQDCDKVVAFEKEQQIYYLDKSRL